MAGSCADRSLQCAGPTVDVVALNAEAAAVYVQWLMTSADQITFGDSSQLWLPLKPDEVLLEFAYTFTPFRGMGVMGDAMGRLLRVAAQSGARWARTYVSDDKYPEPARLLKGRV